MTWKTGQGARPESRRGRERAHGIVIKGGYGCAGADPREPRIAAFIWGGKVTPAPTLPFGRWKGAA